MDTNKMRDISREQFEAWVKTKWPDTYMERIPFGQGRALEGNYWEVNVQMLWSSWKASRDAVAVDLPDYLDTDRLGFPAYDAAKVDLAIEAQGLKVQP